MSDWCNGKKLPQMDYVVALADVLGDDRLLDYARRLRTKTCAGCDVAFVDLGKNLRATHCSKRCSKTSSARRKRRQLRDAYKADRASLALHREAVAASCDDCEPSGLCVTAECRLRPVSPLPLLGRIRDTGPVQRRASDKMLDYIERRYVDEGAA